MTDWRPAGVSTVWRAVAPAHPEEVTAFLSDVSSAMFSMNNAPEATDDTAYTTADDGLASNCSSEPLGILGCENDNGNERTH